MKTEPTVAKAAKPVTLLEKAMTINHPKRGRPYGENQKERLELALAYLWGDVVSSQVAEAMDIRKGNVRAFVATALMNGLLLDLIEIRWK